MANVQAKNEIIRATAVNKLAGLLNSPPRKLVAAAAVLAVIYILAKNISAGPSQPQYQTAQAEKGTLVTSVSASGNVTSGGTVDISTSATGTVDKVYLKPGETVKKGQTIATLTPDQDSQQRQASAWSSYLSAKNTLASSQASLYTLQNSLFVTNQKLINDAVERNLATDDPTYIEENANWLAAQAQYVNQENVISQAQAAVDSAYLSYLQASSSITAPASGMIKNLAVASGLALVSQTSSTTSNSSGSQVVGTINLTGGQTQAIVDLSEIDATQVHPGQKATMTLDALPGKTFTGTVAVIDTSGTISSGVTSYPATIVFDSAENDIYPNMSVTAKIVTSVKDNALIVPSSAVQTANSQTTVRVLKNGKLSVVPVQTGAQNDTQTEITSGLSEGDSVVTNFVSTSPSTSGGSSPFGGGGFGGARFIRGG